MYMAKVYMVINELDGCPPSILCVKKTKDSALIYLLEYANLHSLEKFAWEKEKWYSNDAETVHMVEMELED